MLEIGFVKRSKPAPNQPVRKLSVCRTIHVKLNMRVPKSPCCSKTVLELKTDLERTFSDTKTPFLQVALKKERFRCLR